MLKVNSETTENYINKQTESQSSTTAGLDGRHNQLDEQNKSTAGNNPQFVQTENNGKFECDICGKLYKHKQSLATHQRIHTGNLPFVCDVCGKCFSCKSRLKKHSVVHSSLKPFVCDVCSKCFARKWDLTNHKRYHTGD